MSGERHRVLFGVVMEGYKVGVVVVVMVGVGVTLREGLRVGVLSSPSVGEFTVHRQSSPNSPHTTSHDHNHRTAEAKNSKKYKFVKWCFVIIKLK